MLVRLVYRGIQVGRVPIHLLSDERSVRNSERHRHRVQRGEERSSRVSVRPLAGPRGGRRLILRQTIHVVVEQENGKVHVVADGMNPVARAYGAAVPIPHYDKHVQIGPAAADAARYRQRSSMQAVEAVCLQIVRKTAGSSNTGYDHRLLRRQLLIAHEARHCGQDSVIAATRAPAGLCTQIIGELEHARLWLNLPRFVQAVHLTSPRSIKVALDRRYPSLQLPFDRARRKRSSWHLRPAVHIDRVCARRIWAIANTAAILR